MLAQIGRDGLRRTPRYAGGPWPHFSPMGMPGQDRNHYSDDEEHDECDRVYTPRFSVPFNRGRC